MLINCTGFLFSFLLSCFLCTIILSKYYFTIHSTLYDVFYYNTFGRYTLWPLKKKKTAWKSVSNKISLTDSRGAKKNMSEIKYQMYIGNLCRLIIHFLHPPPKWLMLKQNWPSCFYGHSKERFLHYFFVWCSSSSSLHQPRFR